MAPTNRSVDGWYLRAVAALDLETTGVDPRRDRILSFAALSDRGTDLIGYVNPGVGIPSSSADVHGITTADLSQAPESRVGLLPVLHWVADLVDRQVGLVVYNAPYDLTMLRAEAERLGLPQPDWQRLLVIDPFVIDWGVDRERPGPRRLTDVANHYGVVVENAHDATCDALAARQIAVLLGTHRGDVVAQTLPMLMAQQRYWAAARAMQWNRAAMAEGRRPRDDFGAWPFGS